MIHSVNLLSWILAVTEAYSRNGKSIEHAVPENAGMITTGKRHCMPILPCLYIVACPFVLIARGLNVFCATPRPFPQTNYSQTGKAIRQMQLAYKEKWIELQILKRHFQTHSASDTSMTTHSLNFPHSVFNIQIMSNYVSQGNYVRSWAATQISIVSTLIRVFINLEIQLKVNTHDGY